MKQLHDEHSTGTYQRIVDRRELPTAHAVQVDKRNDEWLLTYWVNADVTIRLRIHHASPSVPDELICEVSSTSRNHEFQEVKRMLWHPDDESITHEWPFFWRKKFIKLSNPWFAFRQTAEWGLALGSTTVISDERSLMVSSPDTTQPAEGEYA